MKPFVETGFMGTHCTAHFWSIRRPQYSQYQHQVRTGTAPRIIGFAIRDRTEHHPPTGPDIQFHHAAMSAGGAWLYGEKKKVLLADRMDYWSIDFSCIYKWWWSPTGLGTSESLIIAPDGDVGGQSAMRSSPLDSLSLSSFHLRTCRWHSALAQREWLQATARSRAFQSNQVD